MTEPASAQPPAPAVCEPVAEREWFALRPDAQAFDEIRIHTVPRFKESYLSGDEWRIHAEVVFLRNGKEVHSVGFRDIQTACGRLYAAYGDAIDDGKAYFAGDGVHCDQEGCSEPASVKLRKISDFSREGFQSVPARASFRCFCSRHKTRGDCGLDDADRNYEFVCELTPERG